MSLNGVIVIDKPAGMTSHDVVNRLRRITGERSIGHLGTLDPMATGVLPLVLGKFTRLAQFFGAMDKVYEGFIRFGFATDTYDAEGETTSEPMDLPLTLEVLRESAAGFVGAIKQMPPPFSAKKIKGVPAYKLARKNQAVELTAVSVEVRRFEILSLEGPLAGFQADVTAGTYIRSLAHELGQKLGNGAHLASLRRTRAGEFDIGQAVRLEELEADDRPDTTSDNRYYVKYLLPQWNLLPALPNVLATSDQVARIRHGNATNIAYFGSASRCKIFQDAEIICIARRIAGTLFQPEAVFI